MKVETKEFTILAPFIIQKDADVVDNTSDKIIKISGCANFSGLDENGNTFSDLVNDVIVPSGMDTSVWASNPQILWQHDREKTIGRGISIEKRLDGIYITAEIHADAMDPQDFYRIRSGLVCMYSLGFKTISGEWRTVNDEDCWFITKSLLLECSAVSIPCNSKSSFSLIKSLNEGTFTTYRDDKVEEPVGQTTKEETPMNIKVKRSDLLDATDLVKFKELGGDVEAEVEMALSDFIKQSVAKEVAAILAAKEAEAQAALEAKAAEEVALEAEQKAQAEAEALAAAEAEEKEIESEFVELKGLVESLTAVITAEEK